MNLDIVNLDALYLVKLIFVKCYFDTNCITDLMQLHLQLDVIRVPVRERVNKYRTCSLAFTAHLQPLLPYKSLL